MMQLNLLLDLSVSAPVLATLMDVSVSVPALTTLLDLSVSVPALTVFLQGLLSFFSPCVLPLLPLYLGYLAGGGGQKKKAPAAAAPSFGQGPYPGAPYGAAPPQPAKDEVAYSQGRTLLNTFFFVLGISAAFFLLGLGMTTLGRFFGQYRIWFSRVGGVIAILFGLYQLGVFGASMFLSRERRVQLPFQKWPMNPLTALVLGFFFSFAWTPCVGPTLTSVLLMAGSSASTGLGFLLIGVYTLGFVLPFLLVGLFTSTLLSLFKKHQSVVRWTTVVGAILMILMGVLMLTGQMERISGWAAAQGNAAMAEQEGSNRRGWSEDEETGDPDTDASGHDQTSEELGNAGQSGSEDQATDAETSNTSGTDQSANAESSGADQSSDSTSEEELPDPIDFTLRDQYGNTHTLSDYTGKIIFLNFWATWCGPCQNEMPEIQALYEEAEELGVQIFAVCGPGTSGEMSEEEIIAFLDESGYTFPVLMDSYGIIMSKYGISAFPTTFFITDDFKVLGYVPGALTLDLMKQLIEQTREY